MAEQKQKSNIGASIPDDDDDDDYMSDALLLQAASQPSKPANLSYHERRRRTLMEQKQKGQQKSLKEIERETREKGLAEHIPEENKGFKMLAKMGFKKGMGLGATPESASAKPIDVTMRQGRLGLGLADPEGVKRHRDEEEQKAIESLQNEQRQDYRGLMNQRFAERQLLSDVRKARKMCEQLDEAKDLPRSEFWFPERVVKKKHDEVVEELDEDGKVIPEYVREIRDEEEDEEEEEKISEFDAMEPTSQLIAVNLYLRTIHHYCLWCGSVYASVAELETECPGATRDDHAI
ncbi:hypothetical protein DFS34DRAFT_283180 [Phlyctochytrium arcticum]|nr:hypothetical protein DFS34DRAFT_283180 [Phlyctochytrium arcticum]